MRWTGRLRLVLTLIPQWLPEDLVASGLVLGNVLGLTGLLDLSECVLPVATQLVELLGLHGLFDALDIDGRHWVKY